jgi:hypothetical protein
VSGESVDEILAPLPAPRSNCRDYAVRRLTRVPYDLLQQRVPVALSRERRIELLVTVRDALLADRLIPKDAARFLGQALDRWLTEGGDLEDRLGTKGKRGSHQTAAAIAKRFRQQLRNSSSR